MGQSEGGVMAPDREAPARPTAGRRAGVEVRGLSKRFGEVAALDDVSLDVEEGDFFALLGPSGCGKTTLLRIIGGFENPTSGDVLIGGKSVLGQPPYLRPTNMIFQHLALFPHMSVFENIAFGLKMKREPVDAIRAKVQEALALVRLSGFESRGIDQLSGGQKQRVAMARALVNGPSVLLLDEPLGALDLQLRLQMHDELRRLHRSLGSTFVFVTHDQGEAITLANRIAVMNAGKVVQVGTPEEIYDAPQTRFVAQFIGQSNLMEGRVVEALPGRRLVVECSGVRLRCRTAVELPVGSPATLSLRYERVQLSNGSVPADAVPIAATVTDRTFMGSAVRLNVRTAGGLALVADVTDVERAKGQETGRAVELQVSEAAATVLRD
jgi:spermidine/putrescine transport system ATP-binding protein